MKFDLDNALCLCSNCHFYFTNHPAEFKIFVDEILGEGKYLELKRRSNNVKD